MAQRSEEEEHLPSYDESNDSAPIMFNFPPPSLPIPNPNIERSSPIPICPPPIPPPRSLHLPRVSPLLRGLSPIHGTPPLEGDAFNRDSIIRQVTYYLTFLKTLI